ncbi:demethylmenaquinone methyltransferase [Gordonia otitidis]|uniref:Demethylmenaquinone methyltransferase n=1 Tax=Gordonia otitidis (strain DSM 44809 / CCUG 52243 / JCM 12355 / NBRC 100426 / IFM 10032) TaxID=1108044 RepID=H5TNB3_GORO1|nr:demethylmenaquinone methyltransferase [Gordonia otitidis]UEA57869.1 demethylmenaquinone methyltransferase [Gordonia otitidis]GAB34971.1 demethylmenaquinone methyltransferase [Gordonia otitidis NBRC 100426]
MAITDRAGLDKAPAEVAAMFDGVAKRYDITNTVLSFAQDRRWRKATRKALALGPSDVVLDLAAGTAVSTVELSASGAKCIAADFSLGMLKAGADRDVPKVAADALALPFADGSFDAATISFGLRNVNDVAVALGELNRVLKTGGRLAICEFSTPTFGPFRTVYMEYLMKALPAVATKVSSNPAAYVYLAESIRAWPDQFGLGDLIRDAGFTDVRWQNLTGGIAAVHTGRKA